MTSLMIVEPHSEGHHLRYARWISREAVARGYEVYLVTSADAFRHPAHLALRAECGERLRTVALPGSRAKRDPENILDSVRLQMYYRNLFGKCYRTLSQSEHPDYVFIPYLDYCMHAIALFGSPFGNTPWGGLVITPIFHLGGRDLGVPGSRLERVKQRAFLRLLHDRSLRAVYTFDETLMHEVQQAQPEVADRLRFLPEPAELKGTHSRESARQALGIPSDVPVILVYGALDGSKGIDALMAATGKDTFPKEAVVLLAGTQDTEVRALLSSSQARALRGGGRLYEWDKYLYGEDEHAVFQAADIVWIGYRHQYISSGVLIQAAMAGLPIVACREGLIGWLTRRHGLGPVVNIDDSREVAEAIRRLVRDPGLSAKFRENGRRFSSLHNVEHFSQSIGEELLRSFPPHKPQPSTGNPELEQTSAAPETDDVGT